MKILVVEDSPTQAEQMRILLEQGGYEVVIAPDGERGMEECLKSPAPSAVITDVGLPGMDGFELIRRIKKDPDLCSIPVMCVTTLDKPSAIVESVAAGADNFLSKPFDDQKVLTRVRRMIEHSRPTPTGMIIDGLDGSVVIEAEPSRLAAMLHSALEDAIERTAQLDRQRQQLATANHQRQELMGTVAHELRTPLNVLNTRAELELLRDGFSASDTGSLASVVRRNVGRMVRIIDDLVDLTSIDLGTLTTTRDAIDLGELVRTVVSEFRATNSQHPIELDALGSQPVMADSRRLEQVLGNLLSNAAKYSDPGATIHIAVERVGDRVEVAVTDRGIGLSEAEQSRVFERYYRSTKGQSRAEGAGLGLHICKHIIELHGGSIGVRSREGKGSTFFFSLPSA
jgi:signal transduction histidine kinase